MRKEYVTPRIVCEEFQANEYVAACGDSGTVYKFVCDAGYIDVEKEHELSIFGSTCGCGVKHDWNNVPDGTYTVQEEGHWTVYRASDNQKLTSGYYHPCGTQHEADSDGIFFLGYMDNQYTSEEEKVEVMVWRGPNNDNVHCTTNLDMNSWETAKS